MEKHWLIQARSCLAASLKPIPHEINELDWKNGLSNNNDRLIEHLIAFANYPNGGYLVYGIEDASGKLDGIGQRESAEIIHKLTNLGREGIEPPLVLDHAIIELENVPILFIRIPEQDNKPVHRRGKSIEEVWIRSGASTRKASRQEIGGLLLHSRQPSWERLRASPLLDTDEVLQKLDLIIIAQLLQRSLPQEKSELMRWLVDENMVSPDGNGYYITNLGGIAAARDLTQFDTLARKRIRIIRYQGTNKVNTIDEKIEQKGYAIVFEDLIKHLTTILPHSEAIRQSLRTQVTIYPEIALRELIANTLIHQDFSITGTGPTIEIFDDRIEFTSPGQLLPGKQLDRLIGTKPESRNEDLASTFRRYRICEERGTGFQKVITAVELFCLPPVIFTQLENAFQVTLYSPRKFVEMSQKERIEACYQHAVLQYLSSQALTNTTLRERLKVNDKQRNQVTNLIAEAVKKERIKRKEKHHKGHKFAEYLPYWA